MHNFVADRRGRPGDGAATEALFSPLYSELHRLADRKPAAFAELHRSKVPKTSNLLCDREWERFNK